MNTNNQTDDLYLYMEKDGSIVAVLLDNVEKGNDEHDGIYSETWASDGRQLDSLFVISVVGFARIVKIFIITWIVT